MEKVYLQTSLEKNLSNLSYIFLLSVKFENITIRWYVFYVFNMRVKFHSSRMLFTIQSIKLFFMHYFRSQI